MLKNYCGNCVLQNHVPEDVLGLSVKQAVVLVSYVLAEASGTSSSDSVVQLLDCRLDFMRTCCTNKRSLVNAVINHLAAIVNNGR